MNFAKFMRTSFNRTLLVAASGIAHIFKEKEIQYFSHPLSLLNPLVAQYPLKSRTYLKKPAAFS